MYKKDYMHGILTDCSKLRLSVLNSTKTAYSAFVLEADNFFENYSFTPSRDNSSTSNASGRDRFCCQVFLKVGRLFQDILLADCWYRGNIGITICFQRKSQRKRQRHGCRTLWGWDTRGCRADRVQTRHSNDLRTWYACQRWPGIALACLQE